MLETDPNKKTVAILGAGDVAHYLIDELLATSQYNVILFSRASRAPFNTIVGIKLIVVPYTTEEILPHLDTHRAEILFSFVHSNDPDFYVSTHNAMLKACKKAITCKRFVPSECGGDLDNHANKPRFYIPTHQVFRKILKSQDEISWTLLNGGWFMDYFVPPEKSYMKSLIPVWPVDLEKRLAEIPGTGNEPIGFTAARDLAKACVKLVEAKDWEKCTYVCGEVTTWNRAMKLVESFYGGKWVVKHKNIKDIERELVEHKDDEDPSILWKAYMDEWNYSGASALPWDKVLKQREKFFGGVKFRSIKELMEDGTCMNIV